jgi:hypothetical protein
MDWERRDKLFLAGAPLAVIPALAFLPLFTFLVIHPSLTLAVSSARPTLWMAAFFPALVFAQMLGSVLVGFAGLRGSFSYVTFLAAATAIVLMVIAGYTGLFFAIFAGRS